MLLAQGRCATAYAGKERSRQAVAFREPGSGMATEHVIETVGLTKEFAGFTAVNKVDLKVRRGSIHALIGPNGAGKTTCFNLITKFLTPTSGRILYNGRDITALSP